MTNPLNKDAFRITAIFFALILFHLDSHSKPAPLWENIVYSQLILNLKTSFENFSAPGGEKTPQLLQLICPENINANTDIDECSANVTEGLNVIATSSEISELTWKMTGATRDESPATGINQIDAYIFEVGVTFIDYFVTDKSGNSTSCSFTVVISDNQIPQFSAPEDITTKCNGRIPTAYTTLQAFLNAGGYASDNCQVRASSFKLISEERDNKDCPYTITRTYQVEDYSGNEASVEQFIYVEAEEENTSPEGSSGTQVSLKSGMATYTAVQSGNWNDPNTWGGYIPTFTDDVAIPSGITVTVNSASVCNSIDIQLGGTVNYSGTQTLRVYGNWTNNGTFTPGTSGTVEFTGSSNAIITGNTSFEELILSKGDLSTTLTINGTVSVSAAGSLTLSSGLITVPAAGSLTINPASNITLSSVAGLDVTGGSLTTGNFNITNQGLIRISSGTANFGTSSNNIVQTQTNGAFIVSGGSVNFSGVLNNSASGTLSPLGLTSGISVSGGTVTVATSGNLQSNVGSLNVTAAGNLDFTGGTIVFQHPSSASTKLDLGLISGGGTKNTVGGTFQFGNGSTSAGSVFNVSAANVLINRMASNAAADIKLTGDLLVNQLALNSSSTINLNGNALQLAVGGTGTKTFPIDDGSGNSIPASINITSGTFASGAYVELETTNSKHPNNANTNNYLNRYWTVLTSGITNPVYNISATYSNGDVSGSEFNMAMGTWSGSLPWTKFGNATTSTNTISATGISASTIQFAGITSDPPTVSINNGDANVEICFGSSTTLTAVATGDPTLTYSWSPSAGLSATNSSTPSANPAATTTYTVTVTDGNGFTASDDIEVIVHPTPTATAPADQEYCNGENTWSIPLTGTPSGVVFDISGGTSIGLANQTGVTTVPIFTATTGSADISVIPRANGCTGTPVTYHIDVHPTPVANSPGNKLYCSGATTSAIALSGSPSGVLFDISGGASIGLANQTDVTQIPAFTAIAGSATVSITPKANGCTGNPVNITISVTSPISASAAITDAISCFGGTANILVSATGGTTPYTFNFDGKTPNSTGVFGGITGSVSGVVYNWSVTDLNGCAAFTGAITVNQPQELTAGATVTTPITCNGGNGTVTITASGGTAPLSYTFNGITNTTGVFNNIVAGNSIAWSVTDARNCGPVSGTLDITQPSAVAITSANVTTPIACHGGTGIVTIVGAGGTGTLYYTFNGQTNTSGVFNNVYAGTGLSYSITDDNGCGPVYGTIDVTEPTAITANASVTSAILCNGGTAEVTIVASGGTGAFTFTFNGISNGTGVFPGVFAGANIPWSVSDANGCGPVSGTLNITQPAVLAASVSVTTPISCFGGTAEVKITSSGGTGAKTYTFNGVSNSTGIFTGILAQNGIPWSVADANGCSVSGIYDVTQPTQIVINTIGSNSAICNGSTLTLNSSASGGTGTLKYNWTGPNGFTANNAQNPTIPNATPAASGTYTLTVTDANNCTATSTTSVTVYSTPAMADPADQNLCHNSATSAVNFSGADSYTWTNNDTSIGLAASGSGNIPSFTATNTTSVPVTATITVTPTTNGCTGTPQTFTITVNPIPTATAIPENSVYCEDPTTNIVLSSDVAGATFTWTAAVTSGSVTGYSNGSGNTIVQNLNSNGGTVQYTIIPTANGCVGSPISPAYSVVEVVDDDINRTLNITGTSDGATVCPGDAVQYNLQSRNGNSYWIRFVWQTDNPNIGLASTGGPLNNDSGRNHNVFGTISFNAENSTGIPQTANVMVTAVAYRRFFNWFLCEVISVNRTITVDPFVAACPTDYEVSADAGACDVSVSTSNPLFDCSPNEVTWQLSGATSGTSSPSGINYLGTHSFNVGTTTVTYNAEDDVSKSTTCSYEVTVNDDEAPVISGCPSDFNVSMDAGQCGAAITWTTPSANDNCDGILALSRTDGTGLNSGDIFPEGTTTISYIATDAAGNSTTCSFDVTVAPDSEAPAITCVATPQEVCAVPGGQYIVPDNSWDAVVTDNCSGTISKSYSLSGATTGNGSSLASEAFNIGTTTVTWTASDVNGNSENCTFDVIVHEEPSFTANPVTQTVCLNGTLNLTVAVNGEPSPTLQWRKDGVNISGETGTSLTIDPVQAGDAGSYDVVATNSCASATSSPAAITITNPPVITQQPANQTDCLGESVEFTVAANSGQAPYSFAWEMRPTPADAWIATGANNTLLLVSNIGSGSNISGAEYRVTVTDNCGNSVVSNTATLTVNEVITPVLDIQTVCQGGSHTFSVSTSGSTPTGYVWQLNGSTISDGGAYSGATTSTLTINNAQVSENGTYSASVIFNISQPNNNGAGITTCQSSFVNIGELTVDEGPDIAASIDNQTICPGSAITDIVLSNANGTPGTTYTWTRDNTSVLTGIPASGSGSTISGILSSAAPTTVQTTVFSITATANGCVSTGQVTVSVVDDQAPQVTAGSCPGNINIGADAGVCGAVVVYTAPTFDDNCDGAGLAGTLVNGLASGQTFPVGTTTVEYEYTDIAGNGTATCSFDVIVTDDVIPVAVCQDINVQLDPTGDATITAADIDNGSADNCGTINLSLDITLFDCTNLGNNTVVLTVTDGVGNTATCSANVTVLDDANPVAITASVSQADTLCLDDPTTINMASTGGVGAIEYTFNGVTNSTGIFSVAAGHSYSWSVSNTLGCGTTSGTFYVEIQPDATTPVFTSGAAILCQDAPNETYTATATNSISINYSVSPLSAGTINSSTGEMDWYPAFSGTATITATATGFCNTTSEDLIVDVTPTVGTPTAITVSSGVEPTCQLTNGTTTTTYTTTATNNTGFNWSISDAAAGTIDPLTGIMTWADGFFGTVDIQVTANGCNGPSAMVSRTVNITPTVGTPSDPTPSDSVICQGSSSTTYTTFATDATGYNWSVTGAGNAISGTGTTASVTWNPAFSGVATVSVTANGCNGPSASASTTVNVLPTPVATISGDNSVCQNTFPEPEVVFTNPQALPVTLTYNINGGTSQSIDIPANSNITVNAPTTTVGDFVYTLENVQYQNGPGCINALSDNVTVTIRPEAPAAPGAISGVDYVLPASSETYTISAVINATSYSWAVPTGWTIASGQGTTSITVTTGIAGEDGDISVIAQNDCGDSPAAILPVTINPNLAIVTQPVSQSDCYNNSVLFSVSISGGAAPITYTWQRKTPSDVVFSDIVGDPDITYPINGQMLISNIGSATNPDGTEYQVRITDNAGSDLTSNPVTLTVNQVGSMSPVDIITTICEGENAGFSAVTIGETPISMIWEKDGVPVSDDGVISGSTTTSISFTNSRPSDAGEYRLTVTFPMTQPNNDPGNPNNCVYTSIIYRTLVVNPLPVLSGPSEVCVGQTINWTPNSGGTWVSNDPAIATIANDGTITGVTNGTVTFTFTETATGCSSTSALVTVHPLPTAIISDDSAICEADSASFTISLTGSAPWNITYSDGVTPVTVSGITGSPYSVRVSPAVTTTYTLISASDIYCDAISLTGSATVTVYPLPAATLSGDATVCIGTAAELVVELTGAQPWSITYTDGITPVTVTGITASPYLLSVTPVSTTTYSLTAVSDSHCSGTSFTGSATVTVDQLPAASAGGTETICSNGNATVSGALASNGTILWTHDGNGTITDETTLSPTYFADAADAGNTVTLTMTVTSNNTCSTATPATATFTIIVDPLPVAVAGGSEDVCTGGTVTVSGAGASNGTILWTHDGSGTLTDETTLTPTYTAGSLDSENTVTLTMTVTSDNTCSPQTATAIFLVNVLPEAQVNQPADQEICNGTSTAMISFTTTNTTGTTTYSWTNTEPSIGLAASGTGNIIAPFTGSNSGTAPLVATIVVTPHLTTGGITCDGPSKTFTITVNPLPVAIAPIGLIYCNDILSDTVALSGTPAGVLFDISGGASIGLPNVNNVTAIPSFLPVAGSASITIVPKYNGCTGLPVSFNVTVRPTPIVTIAGGATVCQNSAPPSLVITNPMNLAVVVTYSINGTTIQNVNVQGRTNVSIAVPTNTPGVFTYNLESVRYLDSNPPTCPNNSVSGTATIEVVALPIPNLTGPTDICAETAGNVYVTESGMSNYTWVVSAAGAITSGGTSTDDNVTVTWNSGGSHNISIRYNNSNGCAAPTPTVFPVNVFPLPIPTITGSTSACVDATKIYSTQPGMTNYQWNVSAGGNIIAGGGINDNSVTVIWDALGAQTVAVNYTSADGCDASTQTVKNININPRPVPTIAGADTVCAGSTGNVYTTEPGMSTYVWEVSSGGTITSGGTANSNTATVRWNTDGPQTLSVSYINPVTGCDPNSPTVYDIYVFPKPVPTIVGPNSVCVGSTGNTYTTETGMSNYAWTIASGGTITAGGGAGDDFVTVTWNTTGAKTVKVNYENANFCSASVPTTYNVTVHALPTPAIAGNANVCLGTSVTYSTISGMTNYEWTISAGGSIVSGGTTTDHQVTVFWNNTGAETVSLNYTNSSGCNAVAPTNLSVTVNDLPSPTISGPVDACKGGSVAVYTTQPGMTAYVWSITGGTITSGGSANDSTATVVWNTVGVQTISVNYYNANSCKALVPFDFPVNVVNPAPPSCPADLDVCDGDAPFILSGGSPAGGDYTGPGVSYSAGNYWFDPAIAGPGVHTVDYTLPTICADNCSFEITVTETPLGSASNTTICSGEPANIALTSSVPGTIFTWTSSVTSGSVTGNTNCSSGCGTMITDSLTNNQVVAPGSSGTNAVVQYQVTATKDGCSSTFTVQVQVRPQILTFDLTWNSNFVEDFIEVCAGAEALSDNDIEILHPITGALVGPAIIPTTWNPTFLYGPSPVGPWTSAPGSYKGGSYYEWLVDFSVNNRLGYHYFILRITDPVTGCIKYSNVAILNIVSSLTVEAGDPEYLCGGSTVALSGAYVGGIAGSTPQAQWSVYSMNPTYGSSGSLSSNGFTSSPASVTYTPPSGYVGEVTLRLLSNDPDGSGACVAIADYRTVTVVPPTSFLGCLQLASWDLAGSNSNGTMDDTEEPCLVTVVGSDNMSGTAGTTDITHCTGAGSVAFDWTFLAPPNKIIWHQEDQKVGSNSGSSTMTVARPNNVSAGDLIIVTIHVNDNNLNISGSGFTLIRNTTHSSYTATVASLYKIATGSEPASYSFNVSGGSVDSNDRIYATRVTGHDPSTPIGNSSSNAVANLTYPAEGYMSYTIPSINTTVANSMLVSTLAIDIIGATTEDVEFINSPIGTKTMYYNDVETSARAAIQQIGGVGATGTKTFSWPSYNSRNRRNMYVAGHTFIINPASNEEDAGYYLLNGTPTLLGKTNGSSGSRTVSVSSGDSFGFRVGTTTNTGGPGRLIIYNLTMPNDIPVLSGIDTVFVADCQAEGFAPTFIDPIATDDCDSPVIAPGYPVTDTIISNGCVRKQKRTWVYVDECGAESQPFEQIAIWSVLEPIILGCPTDPVLEACLDPDSITSAYNNWVAGFTATGGCDLTTNLYAVPPLILTNIACGDTLQFTFVVSDDCGQIDSCTSTFTVQPVDTLIVFCPADTVLAGCTDPDTISAAYDSWKAGFYYNGGCATVTDNMDEFPALTDMSCGGQLEFIYSVYNSCGQFESCISTFTVEPPDPIAISVPAGVSLPLCSRTTDIETAYNDWKAQFGYTGGCNVITNIDSIPDLGDITCGGTLTFTYTVRNANSACEDLQEGTSTFTVAEAPDLIVSCPADTTIAGCLGIQAITDAYDTWVDGFRATGGCNITTNIDSIPPLGGLICNGQITFTYIVGNDSTLCSDHVECTSTFTIGAAPLLEVITPSDTTIQGCNTSQDVIDAFNAWKARFDYVGGCAVSTSDLSVYDLPSSCGGTVTVVYTVWDNCSQAVSDSAHFTLNPDFISVNAPLDEIQAACQTQVDIDTAFADWKAKFGFSGGCGTIGTDLSSINAPDACGGTIVVNYSAQDVCGQVVNSSAIFTIDAPSNVLQEPSFDNPVDITIYRDDACNYDADPAITGSPTNLADNCTAAGNLTMSYTDSIASGSCTSEILIYRTWTVMDNCLNETSEIQLITVTDTTPPVVICAPDVTTMADAGACEATNVDLGTTTATDNCILASLVGIRNDGLLISDPFPVGTTTITWTATDGCSNSSFCIQLVTVIDDQPPTIFCPANVEQDAGPNNCYLENVVIPDPTVDDNCVVASVTWEMTGATVGTSPATGFNYVGGETFNVGLTTVIYTVADSAGNTATCSFDVIIHDVTPPVIDANCVDATDTAAPDMCSKIPATLNDPIYHDTCWPNDSITVRWDMTGATSGSGFGFVTDSAFNVGVTYVTYYFTDPDGNEATCDFEVTILDVTPPVITAGCTSVTEYADPDNCSKIPTTLIAPDYYDTCWPKDSLDLTYTITGATTASGSGIVTGIAFNVGVSFVTYTVTDPDGNTAQCTFTVTIVDVTPPVIDINGCISVSEYAAPDSCSKIPVTITDPDYNDTCWPKDSLLLSYTITGATTGAGTGSVIGLSFNVGVSTVTYTVEDPDGNTDDCSFNVTIIDITPPEIDIFGCQDVTDTTDAGNCTVIPANINDPGYFDDCWPVDSLTLIWRMTGATTGNGTGSVRGETFNTGITTVTYIVSDPDGNEDSCSFTVTILPFDMPAFSAGCPPDVVAVNDPTICGATLTIPVPTVIDPCNLGYVVTNDRTGTDDASGYYPVDTTYVVWTITPTLGDPTTCTQMVIVTDVEDPVIITCPIDQNIEGCDSTALPMNPPFSSTLATSSYAEFSDGINQGDATDNCGIISVTYIDVAVGVCPMVITRTWTVYDAAGNSASCDQTITIGETEPPVVDCPGDFETPSEFDSTFAYFEIPAFAYSDNCTDSVDIQVEWVITGATTGSGTGLIPSPYQFNRGVSTITYTFTDNCGNQTTCEFDVNVLYPPDITCLPPDTLQMDLGVCYNHIESGDLDNPGVPSNTTGEVLDWIWTVYNPDGTVAATGTSTGVSPTPVGPVDFQLGTSTIHWYASNLSGHDECDQLVTVVDEEPPTFTADPYEDCVELLYHALYTGNVDNLELEPDYPDADYDVFYPGDTALDIDLGTYVDNCCIVSDGYTLRWEIDFDGNDPSEPSIIGYGQPSTYVDPVSGLASAIYLWGDGVTFQSRVHTISYWITDCHGNESAPVQTTITVKPRPELIKLN